MILSSSPAAAEAAEAIHAVDAQLNSGELLGAAAAPLVSEWLPAVSARAGGRQDQRAIVDGATALVDGASLVLESSASTVALSGGLVPAVQGGAIEFGGNHPGLPSRAPSGRVAVPAGRELGDRYLEVTDAALEAGYGAAVGDT